MGIKRFTASIDTTVTDAYAQDLSTRATSSNMGASDILEAFSIYGQATTESLEKSRVLIKFPIEEITSSRASGIIPTSGSVNFYLKMFNAEHSETVPRDFTISVAAISQSWDEGSGLDMENYSDDGIGGDSRSGPGLGATWNHRETGLFASASIVFDGADSYLKVADNASLSFGDSANDEAFSISAWIYMDDLGADAPIVSKYDNSATQREYYFYVRCPGSGVAYPEVILYDEDANELVQVTGDVAGVFDAETWYHIIMTYDGRGGSNAGSGVKIYVDGTSLTLSAPTNEDYVSMVDTAEPLEIGACSDISAFFDGRMTEVAIWNKELSQAEINQVYNKGCPVSLLGCNSDASSNLVAWWRMGGDNLDRLNNAAFTFSANNRIVDQINNPNFIATGSGFDADTDVNIITTSYPDACAFANKAKCWDETGGSLDTGSLNTSFFTQSFSKGTEDLEVDISFLVEEWAKNTTGSTGRYNNGVGVLFSGSAEDGGNKNSYYTKRFFGRESEFFFKRPVIEARWDSSKQDSSSRFYLSSSLLSSDNLNKLYLYNVVKGQRKGIPGLETVGDKIMVTCYQKLGGAPITLPLGGGVVAANQHNVTGQHYEAGIYTASFAFTSSDVSSFYAVWHTGSVAHEGRQFHTSSLITVKKYDAADYNPKPTYVTSITNLKSSYSPVETSRFRVHIREKDWNPTIYTKAKATPEADIVETAHYKVIRLSDDYVVIPYDTGSASGTLMSYDSQGNYFDLEMGMLEPDYAYGFKLLLKVNGEWVEQEEVHKFRVD
tara:strand:+ start:10035 stop:12371 length:2337 start_codon:yes stop_codon:yes gene_type:complete